MRYLIGVILFFNVVLAYTPSILSNESMQKYAKYYIDVGRTYANEGDYDSAIWFYKRALVISPYSDTAYCNMGLAYYHLDKISKALNMCKRAIYTNPKNVELYKYVGMLYNDTQNYHKAYKAYSKVLELNPKDLDAIIYIADFYGVVKRDYNLSREFYEKAIEVAPADYRPYFHFAYLYIDSRDYPKAIEYLKHSIKLNPNEPEIYHNLFELELIENRDFDSDIESSYISKFKKQKRSFAVYEMLKIMREIYKGKKVSLKSWSRKYRDIFIPQSWEFELLEEWIDSMPKGIKKVKLTRALYIFKEHKRDSLSKN